MTISIIIFNSGLELTKNLGSKKLKHPVFINDRKRRKKKNAGELLLDISVHYSGMSPEDRINRGRPDIIHQILLQYHFSILNHESIRKNQEKNFIDLYIHTNQNFVFQVLPEWRIPVSYIRFRGLMEKLLLERQLENPEIRLIQMTIEELIKNLNPNSTILWSEEGKKVNFKEIKTIEKNEHFIWLIGGFQAGKNPEIVEKLSNKKFRIFDFALPAWKVLATLLTNFELDHQ